MVNLIFSFLNKLRKFVDLATLLFRQ